MDTLFFRFPAGPEKKVQSHGPDGGDKKVAVTDCDFIGPEKKAICKTNKLNETFYEFYEYLQVLRMQR